MQRPEGFRALSFQASLCVAGGLRRAGGSSTRARSLADLSKRLCYGRRVLNAPYAPPHRCSESYKVQCLWVRRLVVLYFLPRWSPGGQCLGTLTRHIRTRSPTLECTIAGTVE